jgi:formylmethanofuran dehydrogenase subunit A
MSLLLIRSGKIYDPQNGIDGEVRNLWIKSGKIVAEPSDSTAQPSRIIDAQGMIIMPGGIDMHAHIAGPKVNFARKLRPEDHRNHPPYPAYPPFRSGTTGSIPSTFVTGYLYAGMGYTTVFDAAIPPLGARHTHEEFHDTPIIDKGFFLLTGNHLFALDLIRRGEKEQLRNFIAWLVRSCKGYGIKIVNPGGVELWKRGSGHTTQLDTPITDNLLPRDILREISSAVQDLGLPHPVHVHCNQLGLAGNTEITLESMKAVEGHRAHLTHIQFHSYGGDPDHQETFCSGSLPLIDYVNSHSNLTVDVGQVMFGNTTSMTGDGPLGYYLHRVLGKKWFNAETELEAGCGIVPIEYKNKSLVHALQWAIGLEWYLGVTNPWQIAMSTDHPNGAAFTAYPEIIQLLMDRNYRTEILKSLPDGVKSLCHLPDMDREYSLYEIAIITRAAPARMLGLTTKGHLGIGADADIAIYSRQGSIREMFETPRYLIKRGEVIVDNAELKMAPIGSTLHVQPSTDRPVPVELPAWMEKYYSIAFENFPVDEHYLHPSAEVVPCKPEANS